MKFRYLRKALKTENDVVDSKKKILSIKTILQFAKKTKISANFVYTLMLPVFVA